MEYHFFAQFVKSASEKNLIHKAEFSAQIGKIKKNQNASER